jgi:hypothetical protein
MALLWIFLELSSTWTAALRMKDNDIWRVNMATISEFKREYTRAISEGFAAVFAGAGLSRISGYVNWKELVRPLADEIGLSVDKESDLISLAQFYANERGNRSAINQKILNEFTRSTAENENINILTKLPIATYWTTNYDRLIEQGLESNNRKPDVKTTQQSLANNIYDRDAVVYKMHGDVCCPESTVLTKDDYELYGQTHPLFRTALQGDLVAKTFLFIGFSFDDPNLNHVLSQIRVLLGSSVRDHYCFFRKILATTYKSERDFHYAEIRQALHIKDLRRYGIQAVELDSYSDITDILLDIERRYLLKSIFISGAFTEVPELWQRDAIENFAYHLAKKLVEHDYRIVSGFGLGIGSSVINGGLDEIMKSKYRHVDEHLCLRPFPQNISDVKERNELYQIYREDMLDMAGIAVFIFGNKKKDGAIVNSDGMISEFEIAKKKNKIIIPVGSTGGAAKEIYDRVNANIAAYPYLTEHIERLGSVTNGEELIELIYQIILAQQI